MITKYNRIESALNSGDVNWPTMAHATSTGDPYERCDGDARFQVYAQLSMETSEPFLFGN